MKKLIIFGTENFGEISHHYFTTDSDYVVAGFTADAAYVREPAFKGLPVVAFEEVEREFPPDEFDMFVAAGIREVNRFRARKVAEAERKGYHLASYLSSRATVPRVFSLAPNTMVMEGSLIHPFVQIGRDTIIWPNSQLSFFGNVGNHCWIVCIATGESVTIGDYTFAGLKSVIAPFVKVGESNIIGAGALILSDTKDSEVYRGCESRPARVPSHRVARLLV